ncbi:MAG: hypothetical protein ABI082_00885 [Dokdonella sp.]
MKRSTRLGAKCAGSLCGGNISEIAQIVYQAALHEHVTVWSDANADVLFEHVDRSPVIEPQYVAGTYGMGSQLSDIESDLRVLQRERVPAAIMF